MKNVHEEKTDKLDLKVVLDEFISPTFFWLGTDHSFFFLFMLIIPLLILIYCIHIMCILGWEG